MELLRETWIEVDLDNIVHNFRQIKETLNEETKMGAVLKANAYGHGAIEVAKILEEEKVDYICVAGLNEALELRNNKISTKILVMGYTPNKLFDLAIKNNISLTIFSKQHINTLSQCAKNIGKDAIIHIKIDTGFNRIGFCVDENLKDTIYEIYNTENIFVEGIYSHLALKDEENDYKQFYIFENVMEEIKNIKIPIKHICDSIGMVAYKNFHMQMVRVGASLYGYNSRKNSMKLKIAMTFKSKIVRVREIKKGEGIGYDYSFVADKDMTIGTIPCGYSDGIPRILSDKGYVFVHGKKANILGKICMDQCVIDLSYIDNVDENTEVVIYGENGPDLLDIANLAQTNRNELLSIVSRRVYRVYKKNKKIYKILDYLNGEVKND